MDAEKDNNKGLREMLRGYEMTPSARVWEGIEAASPAPVAPPRNLRPWIYGTAAIIIIVAGIILLLVPSWKPDNAEMDRIGVLVPKVVPDIRKPVSLPEEVTGNATIVPDADPAHNEPESPAVENVSTVSVAEPKSAERPHILPPSDKNTEKKISPKITEPVKSANVQPSDPTPSPKPLKEPEVAVSEKSPDSSLQNAALAKGKLKVFIPNAFTPDNDGTNDIFRPVIKDNAEVQDYLMQIYSRNGVLLFESVNINNGWDGRCQGLPVEDQVCVYVISFRDMEGFPYRHWGTVVIVK